jgi:hypothetical protein
MDAWEGDELRVGVLSQLQLADAVGGECLAGHGSTVLVVTVSALSRLLITFRQ